MFFSRRNSRPSGRKQRPSKRPFRPLLESLEDRITPSQTVDVAAPGSGGAAGLVSAVKAADAYTGGGTFTINLTAGTYSLDTPFDGADPGSALVLNNTTPETTIIINGTGAGGATGTTITTTALERLLQVDPGTNVILENVAITNGKAVDTGVLAGRPVDIDVPAHGPLSAAGGGLLNIGGNVSMSHVSFTGNSANGSTSFTFDGGTSAGAAGGAVFSQGGTLTLDTVSFTNNLAVGGQGGTESAHHHHDDGGGEGPSFTPPPSGAGFDGGFAIGGAIAAQNATVNVVNALAPPNNPTPPLPINFPLSTLTSPLLEATGNMAEGGNGGDGVSYDHAGGDGGDGGNAEGGAIWLNGGTANLVAISLSDNTAMAGKGGNGGSGDAGGEGGKGGFASGGGLFVTSEGVAVNATVYVAGSDIGPDAMSALGNSAVAGNGGAGGESTGTKVMGGTGGAGGFGEGGGVDFVGGGAVLHMVNDTVANNLAQGGSGGVGGMGGPGGGHTAGTGGTGGDAGSATGGGIHISFGNDRLTNLTVVFNTAASGTPGAGGAGGTSFGGAPGSAGAAATLTDAGGIDSAPPGPPLVSVPTVIMTNDLVALNQVLNPGTSVLTPQNDLEGAITVPLIISPTITGSFNYIGTLNLPTTGIGTSSFVQLLTSQAINGNLIGGLNAPANPMLTSSTPINNGGPTFSLLPSVNSPVIDKGTPSVATEIGGSAGNLGQDQRGVLRTTGVDIGSTQFSVQTASLVFNFTGSPTTFVIGNPSSLPVSVAISDASTGAPVSGGFVTFVVTGPGTSTTVVGNSGPVAVNSSGQASDADIILTSPLAPGAYKVTATYSNSSGTFTSTGTETVTAAGAATSVSPGSTSATAGVGGDVSVEATVLSALGGTVNEGTVAFTVIVNTATGPMTVTATSATVTGGVAGPVTLTLPTNIVAGSYSIAETYTDGTDFTSSTANGTLTVSNPVVSPPPPPPPVSPTTIPQPLQVQIVSPPAPTPIQLFIDGLILAYDFAQPNGSALALGNKGLVSDLTIAGLLNPYTVAGWNDAHGVGVNSFTASSTSGSSI